MSAAQRALSAGSLASTLISLSVVRDFSARISRRRACRLGSCGRDVSDARRSARRTSAMATQQRESAATRSDGSSDFQAPVLRRRQASLRADTIRQSARESAGPRTMRWPADQTPRSRADPSVATAAFASGCLPCTAGHLLRPHERRPTRALRSRHATAGASSRSAAIVHGAHPSFSHCLNCPEVHAEFDARSFTMPSTTALPITFGAMTFGHAGRELVRVSDPATQAKILDVFQSHGHNGASLALALGLTVAQRSTRHGPVRA